MEDDDDEVSPPKRIKLMENGDVDPGDLNQTDDSHNEIYGKITEDSNSTDLHSERLNSGNHDDEHIDDES